MHFSSTTITFLSTTFISSGITSTSCNPLNNNNNNNNSIKKIISSLFFQEQQQQQQQQQQQKPIWEILDYDNDIKSISSNNNNKNKNTNGFLKSTIVSKKKSYSSSSSSNSSGCQGSNTTTDVRKNGNNNDKKNGCDNGILSSSSSKKNIDYNNNNNNIDNKLYNNDELILLPNYYIKNCIHNIKYYPNRICDCTGIDTTNKYYYYGVFTCITDTIPIGLCSEYTYYYSSSSNDDNDDDNSNKSNTMRVCDEWIAYGTKTITYEFQYSDTDTSLQILQTIRNVIGTDSIEWSFIIPYINATNKTYIEVVIDECICAFTDDTFCNSNNNDSIITTSSLSSITCPGLSTVNVCSKFDVNAPLHDMLNLDPVCEHGKNNKKKKQSTILTEEETFKKKKKKNKQQRNLFSLVFNRFKRLLQSHHRYAQATSYPDPTFGPDPPSSPSPPTSAPVAPPTPPDPTSTSAPVAPPTPSSSDGPINDDCDRAVTITGSTTINGSTISANQSRDQDIIPSCASGTLSSPGVWYTITGTGQEIRVDTCGDNTNFDTIIDIFTGVPQGIPDGGCDGITTCVARNDNSNICSDNSKSSVSWTSTAGTTYYIFVHGFAGAGNFALSITVLSDSTPNTQPMPSPPTGAAPTGLSPIALQPVIGPITPPTGSGGGGGFFDNICFSKTNLVNVQGKGVITMDQLEIGDNVKTSSTIKGEYYSRVVSFSHKDDSKEAEYLQIFTGTIRRNAKNAKQQNIKEPLEISHDHMVKTIDGSFIRAKDVRVGNILFDDEHNEMIVSEIKVVKRYGLYAPVTEFGTIVVSGITSSCYVALLNSIPPYIQHYIAHALYAPIRISYTLKDITNFDGVDDVEKYTEDGLTNNYVLSAVKCAVYFEQSSPILLKFFMVFFVAPVAAIVLTFEMLLIAVPSVSSLLIAKLILFIVGLYLCKKKRKGHHCKIDKEGKDKKENFSIRILTSKKKD